MNDAQLISTLRRLYASEDKPKGCTPVDLAQVTRFLLQKADENEVGLSNGTLAIQLGCGESTIYESQKRLKGFGWFHVNKGKHRGVANRVTVQLDALPIDEPLKRTIVSDTARNIAARYKAVLLKFNPKRRFRRNVLQIYAFRIQTFLELCGGDSELLLKILQFALNRPAYKAKAVRGPFALRRSWKTLCADYHAELASRILAAESARAPVS